MGMETNNEINILWQGSHTSSIPSGIGIHTLYRCDPSGVPELL